MNRMNRRKPRIPLIALLCFVAATGFAESVWSGSAAVSRFGELPAAGYYAASSSFQTDTRVTVTNLQNGSATTVTIAGRVSDPSLFMLLSADAATELGIRSGDLVQVRATVARSDTLVDAVADDRPFSRDPDINPAAFVASEAIASISPDDGRDEGSEPVAVVETPVVVDEPPKTEVETGTQADTDEPVGPETTVAEVPDEGIDPETTELETTERLTDEPQITDEADIVEPDVAETTPPEPELAAETEPEPESIDTVTEVVEVSEPIVSESETVEAAAIEPIVEVDEPVEPDVAVVVALDDIEPVSERVDRSAGFDEPVVVEATSITVSALLPEPELDETTTFVLLTPPDEPEVPETSSEQPEVVRDGPNYLVLDAPEASSDESVFVITPPEPVFIEKVAVEEPEEPEEVLSVVLLDDSVPPADTAAAELPGAITLAEPEPVLIAPGIVSPIIDPLSEPTIPAAVAEFAVRRDMLPPAEPPESAGDTDDRVVASTLRSAIAGEVESLPVELEPDEPEFEFVSTDEAVEEPDTPRIGSIAPLSPSEGEDETPVETLATLDVASPEAPVDESPVETTEESEDFPPRIAEIRRPDAPVSGDVEIVLEQAEPRPPVRVERDELAGVPETESAAEAEPVVESGPIASAVLPIIIPDEAPIDTIVETEPDVPEVPAEAEAPVEAIAEVEEPVSSEPDSVTVEIILEPASPKAPEPSGLAVAAAADEPAVSVVETPTVAAATEAIEADGYETEATETEATETEVTDARVAVVTVETPRATPEMRIAETLDTESYYLQLAVFNREENAQSLSDNLAKRYPVTVYRPKADDPGPYRVLVGPLNEDESGALLFMFRAQGYKDAFVRRVP